MLCQSCGRPLPPAAQFCGECGAQVGAPSSPVEAPDSPTVPEGLPVPGAALPPSPPLADAYGSVPPPPPPMGGPPPEFVAGAPSSGGGGRRNVAILVGLGVVLLVLLVGLGFALAAVLGGDDDQAATPTTVATVPEAPTTLPPVTEVPDTVAPPTTETTPTTSSGEPSGGPATIEAFCASAEELGALLQDAIDDPFNADPQQITELSAELSEQAAALTATATPEELERITECTEALNVTP